MYNNKNSVNIALLAVLFIASGGGLWCFALGRFQSTKIEVTELTGIIETRHHAGPMAFSPDGKTLALPKVEGRVELWSLETRKVQSLVSSFNKDNAPAVHVAFSKDGRFLAVDYQNRGITLWDLHANKEQAHLLVTRPFWVADMAFADGFQTLVTVLTRITEQDLEGPGLDRWNYSTVRWRVSTGERQETVVFDPLLLFKALSPDGRFAVLQLQDVGQTVFDLATGKKSFTLHSSGGFIFSGDGSTLVSYHGDEISLRDVPSGRVTRRFVFKPGYTGSVDCLALSPDKKLLAVGEFTKRHVVGLINLESGNVLGTLDCCPSSMMCDVVCFSPDGRILATDTEERDRNDHLVQPLLRIWKIPASW